MIEEYFSERPPETINEKEWQKWVMEVAREAGWLAFHSTDSRRDGGDKGYPDVILAKGGVVWALELKTVNGKVTRGQLDWGEAMGSHWHLLRPGDEYKLIHLLER